jgi:hypothetical protein
MSDSDGVKAVNPQMISLYLTLHQVSTLIFFFLLCLWVFLRNKSRIQYLNACFIDDIVPMKDSRDIIKKYSEYICWQVHLDMAWLHIVKPENQMQQNNLVQIKQ